ncbi:hypothetical protein PJE062_801 [Pseudovibrio sp. JE062]|nr:hypothetical protein PJE062_801 [Pseudovibrio sp. JE062]
MYAGQLRLDHSDSFNGWFTAERRPNESKNKELTSRLTMDPTGRNL